MHQTILSHFRSRDPRIADLIEIFKVKELVADHPRTFFASLCGIIIGQQLSGRVADVIEGRLKKAVKRITPKNIAHTPDETLRNTGMSWSKVRFIKDVAEKVLTNELDLLQVRSLNDVGVVSELTKVKGVGPWTAEMFLMFTLGRPDVFSFGDLGLRRAIQELYTLKKEPTVKQMEKISRVWIPYRTYAALALWKFKDR